MKRFMYVEDDGKEKRKRRREIKENERKKNKREEEKDMYGGAVVKNHSFRGLACIWSKQLSSLWSVLSIIVIKFDILPYPCY